MNFLIGVVVQLAQWLISMLYKEGREAWLEKRKQDELDRLRLERAKEAAEAVQRANESLVVAKTPEEITAAKEELRKAHEKFLNS